MDADAQTTPFDSGLICLVMLAKLHELEVNLEQIRYEFENTQEPLDSASLLRAAKYLGLRARVAQFNWQRLRGATFPCIARFKTGEYVLLGAVSDDSVLIKSARQEQPQSMNRESFETQWSGEILLASRRPSASRLFREFGFDWFVPFIIKYKSNLGEVLLASFFLQIFALVTPLFFQVVVDKVLVHRALSTLDVLAVGLLIVSVFEVLLGGLRAYLFAHTTSRIDVALGSALFEHMLRLPLAYFQVRRVGDTVARVRELDAIRNFLTGSSITLLVDLCFTLVFFAVLYFYSPTLSLVVLATLPLYGALAIIITPILRRSLHDKFNRSADNQAYLVESVTGIETLKSAAIEPAAQRRWDERLAAYVSASLRATNVSMLASESASLINKLMVLGVLCLGARLVIEGEMSVGQLVAFNMIAGRIAGPILRLVQLWQEFQQAGISLQRLGDILNAQTEPAVRSGRGSLPHLSGRLTFDQVSFRYQFNAREILKDVSFDVTAGEIIGIVGPSGSGKSTIAKLLQRLYVPNSGRVLIDGVDIATVDPTWLRRKIGVVLQENILFNRSVRENIAIANPSIPFERVIQVAKLAGAHDFILQLAEAYDTIIGEQGSTLSGGQRQRIAIARALVTEPRILIFDEATSALDYESERTIHENMRSIADGRTVFIIAHRLSSLRHASRLFVIKDGRLIESGRHQELLKLGGYYAQLFKDQSDIASR